MTEADVWGKWRARLYSWMSRDPQSNRLMVKLAGLASNDRVLDVGCGPGAALARAAEVIGADRVAGVDLSPGMVEIARKRVPGADVRVGEAESLPFEDGQFTVIWTIASFHHWPDQQSGLAELGRVSAPGGRVLVMERRLKRRQGHGLLPIQADQLAYDLAGKGFERVVIESHAVKRSQMLVVEGFRSAVA
jgi:ubiquinone/menaquinone biosynthesis C-methylase UbiE